MTRAPTQHFTLDQLNQWLDLALTPRPRIILGTQYTRPTDMLSHKCGKHDVLLMGHEAWERLQRSLPTVRLSPNYLPMIRGLEIETFNMEQHSELLTEVLHCARDAKVDPFTALPSYE